MKYLLGVDGGGTKTETVLCEQNGRVVRHCFGGPSSMTGQTEEKACANLLETISEALGDVKQTDVLGIYVGISGGGLEKNQEKYASFLKQFLNNVEKCTVGSDAVNALSAGLGTGDGIIAIAGTGSSVFSRNNRVLYQVGGWGYLLGDEGSGYDLGRRALVASLRALDGRGKETMLSELCQRKANCSIRELVTRLYRTDSKAVIASYALTLFEAAQSGDSVALNELRIAAENMCESIRTAAAKCSSRKVVLVGSIWKNELYRGLVSDELGAEYEMIVPTLPPVYGSIVEAADLAGLILDDDFLRTFSDTCKEE